MTRGRRICFVRQGYFPQDPRVLKQVTALRDSGWEVDVVCMRREGQPRRETVDGVRVVRAAVQERHAGVVAQAWEYLNFFVRAAIAVTRLDHRRRYDVVQVHTMPDPLVFAALVPKLRGARVILDMHELMPEFFTARYRAPGQRVWLAALRVAERTSVRFADLVLAVNEAQREVLLRRTGVTTSLVHNVPVERHFPPRPRDEGAETVDAFTHGTIAERYGIGTFVDAIAELGRRRDVRATVVGDGPDLAEFKERADRMAPGRVEFPMRIPLEEVAGRIAQAKVCVVPLECDGYMESASPNKLFEYVAVGRPVVAADTSGVREYFDERAVEFFAPGDPADLARKIEAVLDDPDRRSRMVAAAADVYGRVRWDVTKEAYVRDVERLAGPGRR